MDQASMTIVITVEKKCVLILLNLNHLNAWIRIIEHLSRLIKLVITGKNGVYKRQGYKQRKSDVVDKSCRL